MQISRVDSFPAKIRTNKYVPKNDSKKVTSRALEHFDLPGSLGSPVAPFRALVTRTLLTAGRRVRLVLIVFIALFRAKQTKR